MTDNLQELQVKPYKNCRDMDLLI